MAKHKHVEHLKESAAKKRKTSKVKLQKLGSGDERINQTVNNEFIHYFKAVHLFLKKIYSK